MNKKILICLCALVLSACATKDYGPSSFQNMTAAQILKGGERAVSKGDYSSSTKYFEALDALYPFDPEAKQAQLNIIYAYYKAEDHASALEAANRYIHLYPEDKHTDYAYYMKGVINFEKNRAAFQKLYPRKQERLDVTNLREAFVNFQELLKRFPRSVFAKDAEKRMLYVRNLLAEHEISISRFYFKRKAYIAAANRANIVVKHFKGVPQVKEALQIMVKSYRELGADKQADDALRILKLSFPKERI